MVGYFSCLSEDLVIFYWMLDILNLFVSINVLEIFSAMQLNYLKQFYYFGHRF